MSVPIYDPFQAFQTSGASYIDPRTGQPVQGAAAAPNGMPYYQSSQLTQDNATGATASATGTQENPFAGFVDANGGGFGADHPDAARTQGMNAVSNDGSRVAQALNSGDPDAIKSAMQNLFEEQSGGLATKVDVNGNGGNGMAKTNLLTPDFLSSITDPTVRQQVQDAMTRQGDVNSNLIDAGNGTSAFKVDPASVTAANAASDAQSKLDAANATPVDSDPFGQFDDPAHPTHGVITPASEAAMAAKANANPSALTTNPDGSPMNALPVPKANGTTPAVPPTVGSQPPIPPPNIDPIQGNAPTLQPPGTQPPIQTPTFDPFAPFQQTPIKSAGLPSNAGPSIAAY